ncbi:Splicing factor 3B subunit 3, partial [Quaeritorhiza haematococci]
MHLYNLTLQSPSHITKAILGNFSGTKQQEIIVAKHSHIELLRPDPSTGKIHTVASSNNVFGVVRSVTPFRLTGGSKDYIVIGSDSGRITILEYNPARNTFDKVHQETFGKSGCRRIVPGQYLAADPKGRAVMIGAIEKQKLVYILNRDSAARLTIHSPLEAHKSFTITHDIVGVDVGFENPVFAAIEVDYADADQDPTGEAFQNAEKLITYYELDLGLNHVVRKWAEPVDPRANMLIAVPGGMDGPSGVLVCSENYITWVHQGCQSIRVPIPRRHDPFHPNLSNNHGKLRRVDDDDDESQDAARGVIIVAAVVHKLKKGFFIFAQTEDGDVFKITMDYEAAVANAEGTAVGGAVQNIRIKYFDTIPVASAMCLLKTGFLFVASEFGNHYLYQIENLGDDDESTPEYQSSEFPQGADAADTDVSVYFSARGLRNLAATDEVESLSPLVDAKVLNLTDDDTPQVYALCGRGSRSSLRVLRHGLEVAEMAVSELPGNPSAVWTVKMKADDPHDAYIVVSFANETLVLSIGETVEEVTDTGFLGQTPTLVVGQIGDDALVQVYPHGIRHIRADRRVSEWRAPGKSHIVRACCNQRQVVVALSSGELVYFELDVGGQLNEFQERKEMPAPVTALAVGPVPEGRLRNKFLAVGCADNTVRVISLDPDSCLQSLGMQALNASPESLVIVPMADTPTSSTSASSTSFGSAVHSTMYLHIGLSTGVLIRTALDDVTGALSDSRLRFVGAKPVKLFPVKVGGGPGKVPNAVLALSTRPWLGYALQSRIRLTPLSYEALEYGSGFASEQCPEGIVAISGNTLRILTVEKLGNVFNQGIIPLSYTPRRFAVHPTSKNFVTVESENGVLCPSDRRALLQEHYGNKKGKANGNDAANDDMDMDEGGGDGGGEEEEEVPDPLQEFPPEQFGLPRPLANESAGKWASCVRLLNPFQGETLDLFELDENEAAFSVCIMQFSCSPGETFAVVGTAKDVVLSPRTCSAGFLRTYRFLEDGNRMELMHVTTLDANIPYALCPFQGRLLVGMGKILRIYDLGKKKMLRKCENKQFPTCIISIHTQGDRIVVGDVQEAIHYAVYRALENRIIVFADDTLSRWTTCSTMLDYDTVVIGDKFGNVSVVRLPQETSNEVEDDPTGNKLIYEKGYLNGAAHKVQHVTEFHVGSTITSIHKTTLVAGGREVILYTTFLGGIGLLVPFATKDDVEFFQTLEMHMRQEAPPLLGRDHLSYRSYYIPVRCVVDGDLCEMFGTALGPEKKRGIAEELDRVVGDITKKLEDMRNR